MFFNKEFIIYYKLIIKNFLFLYKNYVYYN